MSKLLVTVYVLGTLMLGGCASESANPKNENSSVLQSASPLPHTAGMPIHDIASATKSRLFLVLLDSSKSYKDYEAAIQGLLSAVRNLGPGDRLVIARITGKIDPKDFILLDASTPPHRAEILTSSRNIDEWRKKQRELDNVWQQVVENVKTLTLGLQHLKGANSAGRTDLHGAIEYSTTWLNSQPGDEKTLIIFSDLEHDIGKPTFDPPVSQPDVNNLRVELFFISYRDGQHWKTMETAWKRYFNHAAGFEMLDSGRSPSAAMIPPNAMPRQLPSPFQTRSASGIVFRQPAQHILRS